MRSWPVSMILCLCLVGCASLILYTDPLSSLVAEVRDTRGNKVLVYDLDSDPHRTFIGLAHFSGPRGEERFAQFDRAGNLIKSYTPDGSFVEFDWSNDPLISMTVGGMIEGSLVTETKTFQRTARSIAKPTRLQSKSRNGKSLIDPIPPTTVTVRVSACSYKPRLRDIVDVGLNMSYGRGDSLWFMNKIEDGLYRVPVTLQVIKDGLARDQRDTARWIDNIFSGICLIATEPVEILCTVIGFENPNIARLCGYVLQWEQQVACDIVQNISEEDRRIKEQQHDAITGDFSARPDIAYFNAAGQKKSLVLPTKRYTVGQAPLQFEAQLPCGEWTASIPISGRLSSNRCRQGQGSGQASVTLRVSEDGTSAFVDTQITRTFSFGTCWSGGPYPNSFSGPARKTGTSSFEFEGITDADRFKFTFDIAEFGRAGVTIQNDHSYCDPATGGCVDGTLRGSGTLSPRTASLR